MAVLAASCTRSGATDRALLEAALNSRYLPRVDVIVLTPGLGPETREAASQLRKTIDQASVIPSNGFRLPPHHLVLYSVTHSGDSAHVVATFGPFPQARPGVALLACGSNLDISFQRDGNGLWQESDTTTTVC